MTAFLCEPYLLSTDPGHEMDVLWISEIPGKGSVEYGSDAKTGYVLSAECEEIFGIRAPASESGYSDIKEENPPMRLFRYTARISGLKRGQRVYYRCICGGEYTQIYDFHTAPEPGEPFTIAQMSDLQGINPCADTVYKIGLFHPDLILFSGDATFHPWRADQWFDIRHPSQTIEQKKLAFFPCMQQKNGARLMQYCPTFLCVGNHESDDMRLVFDREYASRDENWSWSVFMQLFSPLFPDKDHSLTGKRYYSADYSDLHITALSVQRCAGWGAYEYPGWRLTDPIGEGSAQAKWLDADLKNSRAKFKWVIMHWHLLNKGYDTQFPLSEPILKDGRVTGYGRDVTGYLIHTFEKYGVNGVSFGHSHVYERYKVNGVHYIEAAYLGCCYRRENEPLHPLGFVPVAEDNSTQSFLIITRGENGLTGRGYRAKDEPELFDEYKIADENGKGQ